LEVLRRACRSATGVTSCSRRDGGISWPACESSIPRQAGATSKQRRVRYHEPGQPRELTFSCYRHYAFLSRDRTRAWLCEALEEARTNFGFQLWAYVIMPEHVHLLVNPGAAPERLSRFLQARKEPVAPKAMAHLES